MSAYQEIEGMATLCFEERGLKFQGIVQGKDDSLYALYGKKSKSGTGGGSTFPYPDISSGSQMSKSQDREMDTYDIEIVDCEDGDEFNLQRVHGRCGDDSVSLRCKSVTFITTQFYRGQRADMETQRVIGHTLDGEGVVYKGPIKMVAKRSPQRGTPWVL